MSNEKTNMQKWIEALESDEYEQTTGSLRNADTYCCLGVACDISDMGEWVEDIYKVDGVTYGGMLPPKVVEWLGLHSEDGSPKHAQFGAWSLIDLNDNHHNFKQIARILRNNEEGYY